jgi:hypothetical protein
MAIVKITSELEDSEELPLAAAYLKAHPEELGDVFPVVQVTLSQSKKWLMIDTEVFRLLLSTGGGACKEAIRFFREINNCIADCVVLVLERTPKGGGAYLAIEDEMERMAYFWNDDESTLTVKTEDQAKKSGAKKALTAASANAVSLISGLTSPTPSPNTTPDSGDGPKKNGKSSKSPLTPVSST